MSGLVLRLVCVLLAARCAAGGVRAVVPHPGDGEHPKDASRWFFLAVLFGLTAVLP